MTAQRMSMTTVALTASAIVFCALSDAHAQAPLGPEGCKDGFVFREAIAGDRVCVAPTTREQTRRDNAEADSRKAENAFGQPGCIDGFVFRELTPDDKVCVTPAVRDQIMADNALAEQRRGAPGGSASPAPGAPAPGAPQGSLRMGWAFQAWARRFAVTNASLVVTQNAALVGTWSVGSWNVDTPAHLASVSKAITGVCVMTLIDGGRLTMETSISTALPRLGIRLPGPLRNNLRRIRVGHLLRHASGLGFDPTQGASFGTGAAAANPAESFARMALRRTLASVPGTRYAYNNANYAILGLIIAAVSGEDYETYCKRAVLTPRAAPNARIGAGVRAMGAFGGWEMSAREYSNFYVRTFDPRSLAFLTRAGHNFLTAVPPTGFTIPGCAGCNYGLGVIVVRTNRPVTSLGPARNLFHHGDWSSTLTTPAAFSAFAANWDNGFTAVVTYDRVITPEGRNALDNDLRTAAFTADP